MKNNKTCSVCHEAKDDVKLRYNPYTDELYGDEKLYLICDDCCHELCMEI